MKFLFFLLFFFFSVSLAQTDLELENKARLIGNELRCPVCGGSAITESPSDFARSMLAEVKAQVKAGKSESEIKAYFSGKYGSTVLLKPPFQGVNMLVWILPVLVLLVGAAVLWNYLKRSSHQNPEEVNPAALEQVRRQLEAQRDRSYDGVGHVAGKWGKYPPMIAWFILLGVVAVLLAVFAILPLRGNSAQIRVKTKKDELEDELNAVYAQIRELERQQEQGEIKTQDYERFRLRDETRAAKILQVIETTSETPVTNPSRASLRGGILLFTLTAGLLGGLSAFAVPALENLALRPVERELYANQNELLKLAAELNETSKKNETLPEAQRLEFSLETLMKYGDVAWELDRFEDAAKGYGAALRQFTDTAKKTPQTKPSQENIHALSRYGQILFFNGDNDQALTLLETAAKLGNAEAWLTIGNIRFSSKNDPKGAIAAWEQFLKVNKDKAFGARIPDLIAAAKTRLREADPGAKLFAQSCAGCHGAEAQGLVGPNLKTSVKAKSPDFLKKQLTNGSSNQKMPAFKTIQGKDLENIIKFVTGLKP